MTSLRQIEANRRNSQNSTGPRTEAGKQRSRRNAMRHGLCAETVIECFEDIEDYKAFEATIILDYDAQTAVERELVLRLASLLWRIRRATAIDTDLFRMQAELLRNRRYAGEQTADSAEQPQAVIYRIARSVIPDGHADNARNISGCAGDQPAPLAAGQDNPSRGLTDCFLRLADLDNKAFSRLGRYEARLWRQVVQTTFVLRSIRRR